MNAVPAKVAGVPRLVMVVPAPDGKLTPLVLAAAKLAGVDEIYRVGGAQAVAALAYGTATIAPVAKIVGPGNAYVAAAKRLVFGKVGIDMIAGPSEVLILADSSGQSRLDRRRSAGAGRARRQRAVDPDHRRRRRSPTRSSRRSRRSSRRCRAPRSPARRWRDFGAIILVARARRGGAAGRSPSRPSISRSRRADAERLAGAHPQCRRDLPRRAHAGGDRRLCRRLQPRAADRALGALLLRARRARLHEAHLDPQMRARAVARARRPPRSRSARPRGSTRMPARSRCASIRDDPPGAHVRPEIQPPRRGDARRDLDRPLQSRRRARARGRDLRSARGQQLRPGRRRRRALRAASEHHRQPPGLRHPARRRHAGDGASAVAHRRSGAS